jgi:Tfp pilus assembly protein PilF
MSSTTPSARDRGLQLLREGSLAASVDFLRQALEENPSDADLYLYLALAYAKTGDISNAEEILEKAADIAPTSAKVHYNLGVAYQKSHKVTQAKEEYLRYSVWIQPMRRQRLHWTTSSRIRETLQAHQRR